MRGGHRCRNRGCVHTVHSLSTGASGQMSTYSVFPGESWDCPICFTLARNGMIGQRLIKRRTKDGFQIS
jgi:hypothetical protein